MSAPAILGRSSLVAATLLVLSGHASASTPQSLVTPYDKTFVRTNGQPNGGTDTFSAPTAGIWFLTVESTGATAGSVTLNGVQVYGPSDFKKNVSLLRASVVVGASNTIDVRLSGKPGEQLRVRVDGIVRMVLAVIPDHQSLEIGRRKTSSQNDGTTRHREDVCRTRTKTTT